MTTQFRIAMLLKVVLTLGIGVGCGGQNEPQLPIGTVGGTISLDGKPLAKALVIFTPNIEGGRTSAGLTDSSGRYSLHYTGETKGANVGRHEVRLSTAAADAGAAERVPKKYNAESTLTAEVKTGDNVINFDL